MRTLGDFLDLKTYYSFSDGVDCSDGEILGFISKSVNTMKKKMDGNLLLQESFCSISTGNTKVFGEIYRQSNGLYTVYVTVTKNFKEKSIIDFK